MLVVAILTQFSAQRDARIQKLAASGPPVGCFDHANYPTLEVPLLFPTELYLFSDFGWSF
jgi:serine phosphatase RsbU (regulator of sigma subunit)